ncbi:hypothetical protein DYB36_011980 [Aphanomyces astaci]|uniref:Uncharacterized protein n=1 Tax=Aphanomyces astaci TaxID=112090 RepID=A0A397BTR6_APHAT|nr:hypothetical protein DYB36_011980 [Aphanomyces astaci]
MASSIDLTSAANSSSVDDWGPSTKSNSVDLTAMPSPLRRRHEVISVGTDVTPPQREPTWIVVPSDSDDDDNDVKVTMAPTAHVNVSDAAPRPRPAKRTKNHLATSKKPRTAIPLPPAVATKYVWDDGRSRKVPQGWTFPDMTIAKLWMCWFHGSPEEGIGPFRELTQDDFESTTCVSYVRCWEVASVVMSAFLTIAVSNDLIDENKVAATPPATLARQFLAVFERIYPDEDPQTKLMSSCLSPSEWPQDDADVAIAPLVFPRGLTCEEMWRQWFHGTPAPLRQLQPSDFDSPDCKSHWSNAKQFIAHVATTAKSLDLVATKKAIALLDKNALDRVMDAAFTVLASKQEHALTTTQNTKHSVVDEALVAWLNNQAAAATPPPSDLPPLDSLVGGFPIKKLWHLWFHGDSLTRGTPYRRRRWVKDEATKAVLRELTKVAVKSRHLPEVPSIVSLEKMSSAQLSTVLAQVLKELRAVFPVDERPFMQPDTTVTRLWSVLFNLPMPEGVCDREKGKTTKVVAKFPSLSLRAMWVLWWKGDEDGGYRHREWTKGSAEALRKTKHVMEELGRCAAELNVSADELDAMDRDALQKLLPTLFDNLKGRITNARLRDMNLDNTCDAVYKGVVNVRRGRPPKLGR